MSISFKNKDFVRQRARKACEYCGVKEEDSGGLLTTDHYRPTSKGGNDELDNLVYCCHNCNFYKSDYFLSSKYPIPIFNPREDKFSVHFVELKDGNLKALTDVGLITINVLRLNREQLVFHRKKVFRYNDLIRKDKVNKELKQLYINFLKQESKFSIEQNEVLKENSHLLNLQYLKEEE